VKNTRDAISPFVKVNGRIRYVNSDVVIDYLLVGHVCHDLTPSGPVAGGTVTYSGRVAQTLGCRTAVLTSSASAFDFKRELPDITTKSIIAGKTTTFENVYTPEGRQQTVRAVAKTLTSDDLPAHWERAKIVHLGPIANEIDPGIISRFSNSLVGLTPQGWYRRWGEDGRVHVVDWPAAAMVMPLASAVILSLEDLPDPEILNQIREWVPIVVLTEQAGGCTVYHRGEVRQIPAPKVKEVNPTGAGDIFAASFFVRLYQTKGNIRESAEFANRMAANSVAFEDMDSKLEVIRSLQYRSKTTWEHKEDVP
jgi:sugar/nucleoside kinase (ribokinase family)